MAESDGEAASTNMHNILHSSLETQGQQTTEEYFTSPTHVLSPASSLDSEESLIDPDEDPSLQLDLASSHEDQIEKLKEFLSEAQIRGDDFVHHSDGDTVKGLENIQVGTSSEVALAAQMESAARTNMEIKKQPVAGCFPSENVLLQEQKLKEGLDEPRPVPIVTFSTTVAKLSSPTSAAGPSKSPRSVDFDSALKNELDCLFQERATRFRPE